MVRRVTALRHHRGLRLQGFRHDALYLRRCAVLIVNALQHQCRAGDGGQQVLDIPVLEAAAEPGVGPGFEKAMYPLRVEWVDQRPLAYKPQAESLLHSAPACVASPDSSQGIWLQHHENALSKVLVGCDTR